MVRLTHEPIDLSVLQNTADGDGALCLFAGTVRNENAGRSVLRLDYEAYEEMALPLLQEIASEAKRRFSASDVTIVHRLGMLEIGDVSVAIAVASPHRAQAFEACRFAIDALKSRVPIWKKEYYADGQVWLEGLGSPPHGKA
jgi:molybdopterin synthase catalytic subunit